MIGAGWHVRPGSPDDRKLLASFACADLAVRWQAEVEQFIQAQLIDWAFDPHADAGDPRLLLAFTTAGDLFGLPRTNESHSGLVTAPASPRRNWRSWA